MAAASRLAGKDATQLEWSDGMSGSGKARMAQKDGENLTRRSKMGLGQRKMAFGDGDDKGLGGILAEEEGA